MVRCRARALVRSVHVHSSLGILPVSLGTKPEVCVQARACGVRVQVDMPDTGANIDANIGAKICATIGAKLRRNLCENRREKISENGPFV